MLLCEQWAELHPKATESCSQLLSEGPVKPSGLEAPRQVKVVSCHPGWTSTPAVDEAYGSSSKSEFVRKPVYCWRAGVAFQANLTWSLCAIHGRVPKA